MFLILHKLLLWLVALLPILTQVFLKVNNPHQSTYNYKVYSHQQDFIPAFFFLVGFDWSSSLSLHFALHPFLQLHRPRIVLNHTLLLPCWSSLPRVPANSNVNTLPSSISSLLLKTCPNYLKRCHTNHCSFDSTPTLSVTSGLINVTPNTIFIPVVTSLFNSFFRWSN